MWELDYKESWAPKNWSFWTVVLEKTLESLLDCKEIQPVHPKGDQPWVFIGRTDVEAETPIFWPPDGKSWLTGKDRDAGKDWSQEEKGMTEDEMAGWHHWLNGHGFGWTPGVCDGQGGLACCSSWGLKESDTTEQLNWTEVYKDYTKYPMIFTYNKQGIKIHVHYHFMDISEIKNLCGLCKLNCKKPRKTTLSVPKELNAEVEKQIHVQITTKWGRMKAVQ